jgi:hypothetical protein
MNMENATLSARLSVVGCNKWVHTMSQAPIWNLLIDMLRPMDIVSLAIATKFHVRPTNEQMRFYMKWWRQVFYDMEWVEKNGREIVVISKDLVRLNCAIKRWDYFDITKMRLLVMVKETLPVGERDIARRALIASVDTPYMWSINTYQVRANRHRDIQTCVIFCNEERYHHNMYADLSFSWGRSLLEEIPAREPIIVDREHYNQNPDGTISRYPDIGFVPGTIWERDRPHLRAPWFRASYINLRLPNFGIKQSSTRTDYTIATHEEFEFRGYMRLAVKDGSVVVPTIPARVIQTHGAWENYEMA